MTQKISQLEHKVIEVENPKKKRSLRYRIARGITIVSAAALGALAWDKNLGNCASSSREYFNAMLTANKSFMSVHPLVAGVNKKGVVLFYEDSVNEILKAPGENPGKEDKFPFGEAVNVIIKADEYMTKAKFFLDNRQFLEYQEGHTRKYVTKNGLNVLDLEPEERLDINSEYPVALDFFNGDKNIFDITFPLILNEKPLPTKAEPLLLYYAFVTPRDGNPVCILNLILNTEAMKEPGHHKLRVEYKDGKGRDKKLEREVLLEENTTLDYKRKFTQRAAANLARGAILLNKNRTLGFVSGHFPRGGDYLRRFYEGKKTCTSLYKQKGNPQSGIKGPKDW